MFIPDLNWAMPTSLRQVNSNTLWAGQGGGSDVGTAHRVSAVRMVETKCRSNPPFSLVSLDEPTPSRAPAVHNLPFDTDFSPTHLILMDPLTLPNQHPYGKCNDIYFRDHDHCLF
jgi:hypothetical protein